LRRGCSAAFGTPLASKAAKVCNDPRKGQEGIVIMSHSATFVRNSGIAPRVRQIQARWSSDERRQRAEEGRRRREQLFALLTSTREEPEIWAVGAPADDDMRRVAG
jgi:hypothetical protein